MANSYNTNPTVIDTDVANFRTAVAAVNPQLFSAGNGPTVSKIVVEGGAGGSVAGTITITRPADSALLYPPIVTVVAAAGVSILNDNITRNALNWNNFAVTGVTASGARLFIYHG